MMCLQSVSTGTEKSIRVLVVMQTDIRPFLTPLRTSPYLTVGGHENACGISLDAKKDEQYIAICSHTSPEKVYNLNLSVAGKIESIVAVDFANKDAEGHPHNEFAPVAKAQDIIAKEPDEALRACLTALVDEKVKTKEEVER